MKKILIIGSEGFIGSHLVSFYKKYDYEIRRVDIATINDNDYIQVDKANPDFHCVFKDFPADYCLNCSGAASVPFSFEQPLVDFNLNVFNVVKLLDAIRSFSPECKFINFSSAAVYGNPITIPIREDFNKKPISPYGFHKSVIENIIEEYHNFFNLKVCSLRLFSAYGNGLRKQIMFDLYNKFSFSDCINLFGTGMETRDYIHIDDICNVVNIVLEKSDFENDVVNVANGVEIPLNTIVEIFKKNISDGKKIIYSGNVRTGDPTRWQADISKIKKWGYKQTVSLEDGIERYIKWIKSV